MPSKGSLMRAREWRLHLKSLYNHQNFDQLVGCVNNLQQQFPWVSTWGLELLHSRLPVTDVPSRQIADSLRKLCQASINPISCNERFLVLSARSAFLLENPDMVSMRSAGLHYVHKSIQMVQALTALVDRHGLDGLLANFRPATLKRLSDYLSGSGPGSALLHAVESAFEVTTRININQQHVATPTLALSLAEHWAAAKTQNLHRNHRHGAVLYHPDSGEVLQAGWNHVYLYAGRTPQYKTAHAEMHTLLKELRERGSLTRAAGTHVAIAELDKLDWGYQHSEPCPMCNKGLRKYGVAAAVFTSDNGCQTLPLRYQPELSCEALDMMLCPVHRKTGGE